MRYQWIDALQGFGMLLVIASHASLSTVFPKLSVMLTAGYMAIFFILSGYTTKKEVFCVAVKKKAQRLLIPYFFYGIAITSMFSITSMLSGAININEWIGLIYSRYAIHPLNFPNNTFLLGATSPLWFLTAMFVSYIWFYIYVGLKGCVRKWSCIIIYFGATIFLDRITILLPWSIDTSFLCALFIIFGYEFSSYATKTYKKGFVYFTTLLILAGIYIALVEYNGNANLSVAFYGTRGTLSIVLYFVFSIIITIFYSEILKLCNNNIIIKFLTYIGKHSLRLMCIHLPIIAILNTALFHYGIANKFIEFFVALIISLIASVIIEKICHRYSNKYTILRYL